MKIKLFFRNSLIFPVIFLTAGFSIYSQEPNPSPTPPNADEIRILTEEVQLNITAKNQFNKFEISLEKDDLLVLENREPFPVAGLRRVPASILFVLDTGGENRLAKSFDETKSAVREVLKNLNNGEHFAVLEYHDKVNIVQNWADNQSDVLLALGAKLKFGRRSKFLEALNTAIDLLEKSPTVNRHLILISDGTDTKNNAETRATVIEKALAANVTVHILSWTAAERIRLAEAGGIWQKGESRPQRLPEEIVVAQDKPVQDILRMPRIGGILTDRATIRARRERKESLIQSEKDLKNLAETTGGTFSLPENRDEVRQNAAEIAGNIGANYVLTYIPKKPFSQSPKGEVRDIEVVTRKQGVKITVRKKIWVRN